MNTILEEIRRRIKARMDSTDAAGDYDEYADGQGVGLAAALRIINEVEKEHPVPTDVEEAAEMTAKRKYPYEDGTKGAICQLEIPIYREGFKAGAEWQRERLMKEAREHLPDGCETLADTIGFSEGIKLGRRLERQDMMKDAVEGQYGKGDFGVPCINLDKHLELEMYQPVSVIIIKKEK